MKILSEEWGPSYSVSCEKNKNIDECQWSDYYFEHPILVHSSKDTLNIGDNLWVEMNLSSNFNVKIQSWYNHTYKNELADIQNFDFKKTYFSVEKLVDNTYPVSGQPYNDSLCFDVNFVKGELVFKNTNVVGYKMEYDSSKYLVKIALIAKTKGTFVFLPFFLPETIYQNNPENLFTFNSKCPKQQKIKEIRYPVNRKTDGTYDNNADLLLKNINLSLESWPDRIQKESFTFIVY